MLEIVLDRFNKIQSTLTP